MAALVTIASVVVCGWIAVWLLSDVGTAWLGAVAGLPVAMLPASIGTVILRWHTALGHPGRNVRSMPRSALTPMWVRQRPAGGISRSVPQLVVPTSVTSAPVRWRGARSKGGFARRKENQPGTLSAVLWARWSM